MTWSSWAFVQTLQAVVDRCGDIQVILLQKHEMRITLNTNVGKLDPLEVGEAHLLEVFNEAVVVRDMWTGLPCDHDVRHFAELGELVDGASLENAGALGQVVWSNFGGRNGRTVCYWRIEL